MPAPAAPMPLHFSLSLFEIATGLRSETAEVFDLTAQGVCKNALRMIQRRSPLLGKVISTFVPLAFLGYGTYLFVWKPLHIQDVFDSLYSRLFAEIVIEGADPVRQQVKNWMADQTTAATGRSLTLHKENPYGRPSDSPLKYISTAQTSWFKHDGRWLRFEDKTSENKEAESEPRGRRGRDINSPDLAISCFSLFGDSSRARGFLEHIKDNFRDEEYTYIYRVARFDSDGEVWDSPIARSVRTLDTVAMEAETKKSIISSVEKYLAPETRTWYSQRGLPLRKGILLYGPPGTGKTSFSTALAGHFDLELYMLSFTTPDMDDNKLAQLFSQLPSQCVVLLEDVDSAGIQRENIKTTGAELIPKKFVTLSGLLNVIDGAGAAEGRVLIMTSNSANSLDPALVRPGRIDHKILMGNASKEVANALFTHIYSDFEDEPTTNDAHDDHDVLLLAKSFAAKVPGNALSPAELQNFLLINRDDPIKALDMFDDWAERILSIKASGRNVEDLVYDSEDTTIASTGSERGDAADLQQGRPITRRHSF
ncbi:Putative AAA+ ATPase domain, ATPase, AAA-type, core [Septoria linicola]|uniref:AAA+ ATPase domain, ATPase, AAA-type, core n=1 Tax=Septoria linicola TaxID=215465 RepID=A0A9Q9EEZ6_9PEZI|nr:putative AAA+ ATPase domain, ATPase, AAA-type, core [Septoria linicola]USW47444.1 Putative AAA+ ATPase domain, ATPase, AAA-type, core [Septoria linicola]